MPNTTTIAVEDITDQMITGDEGLLIDLEGDPFATNADDAMSIAYEYALVVGVERETADCIRLDFEGLSSIGFPVGHRLPLGSE